MSKLFQQVGRQPGIRHIKSSTYHPQSQGALGCFHATVQNMFRAYCLKHIAKWDQRLLFVLFAARKSAQESLGVSPFEMVFGLSVLGPLQLIKGQWIENQPFPSSMAEYVVRMRQNLAEAQSLARKHLKCSQERMKKTYDQNAVAREFKEGDEVLVFSPVKGQPFNAKYQCPYGIKK